MIKIYLKILKKNITLFLNDFLIKFKTEIKFNSNQNIISFSNGILTNEILYNILILNDVILNLLYFTNNCLFSIKKNKQPNIYIIKQFNTIVKELKLLVTILEKILNAWRPSAEFFITQVEDDNIETVDRYLDWVGVWCVMNDLLEEIKKILENIKKSCIKDFFI